MKKLILIYILFSLTGIVGTCQKNSNQGEVLKSLESKILRMEFSTILFLTQELIEICQDTANRSRFNRYLKNYNDFKRITAEDEKEHHLSLYILYHQIFAIQSKDKDILESREYLLTSLSNYSAIDFEIDAELILKQLNYTKRSIINNYDEGVTNESWLIFFNYDPVLLKSVLKNSGKDEDWETASLRICNSFRENSIPVSVRHRLKRNVTSFLDKYANKDVEISNLKGDLSKCDVTVNLYD